MFEFENLWICYGCKPIFLQKIKEGVEVTPKASSMIGWRVFFFIVLALQSISFVFSIKNLFQMEKLFTSISDFVVGPFIIIALYGFSFGKRIGHRFVWKMLFPVVIIIDIIYDILFFTREPTIKNIIVAIVVLLIFAPLFIFEYIALYRYGFSKSKPWV